MTHKLLKTITSESGITYGEKGDKVRIVDEKYKPWIVVENKKGERFPVMGKNLEETHLTVPKV